MGNVKYSDDVFIRRYEECHRSVNLFDYIHRVIFAFTYIANISIFALIRKMGIILSENVLIICFLLLIPLAILEIYLVEKYTIKKSLEKFLAYVDMSEEEATRYYRFLKDVSSQPQGIRRGENRAAQVGDGMSQGSETVRPFEESEKGLDYKQIER